MARDIDRELDWAHTQGPARTITIPPCPDLLARLQAVMCEGDPDWNEVQAIASCDVAMGASLVRAANSPLYARHSTVSSVEQAMALLGLRQTATQLTHFLTMRALPVNHPALTNFWQGSGRRAIALGYVARQLYGTPPDLAQTFGLFCDVGIPVLMQGVRGYGGTLAEAAARRDRRFVETEQANHRTDHAVVGALVARAWRLPGELKTAICLHHDLSAMDDPAVDQQVRVLIAACVVAEHLCGMFSGQPDDPEWLLRGQSCLQSLQVRPDELVLWLDALQEPLAHVQ